MSQVRSYNLKGGNTLCSNAKESKPLSMIEFQLTIRYHASILLVYYNSSATLFRLSGFFTMTLYHEKNINTIYLF